MFTIRAMTPADLGAILDLEAATPEAPHWGRAIYEDFPCNPARALFVAARGEFVTGFIAAQIVADICELESIAVAPTDRRSRVGTALLSALVDWASSRSATRVQLEVRAGNNSAISFYRRAGFRSDGLRPRYYQNPDEDALLMTLPLHPEPRL